MDHWVLSEAGPRSAAMPKHPKTHWSDLSRNAKDLGDVQINGCADSIETLQLERDPIVHRFSPSLLENVSADLTRAMWGAESAAAPFSTLPQRRMVHAYVLIQAAVGMAEQVEHEVAKLEGVLAADLVAGPYDLIAKVESEDVNGLGKLIVQDIGAVDGIISSLTCPSSAIARRRRST
jgi:DNA-binding Lrp family transcriptional regulator